MKFRNRFLKYARPQIDNDVINLTQYSPNAFCFADGDDDGGGGGDGDNNNDDGGTVTLTPAQVEKMISDGIAASKTKDNDNDNESAFDKIEREKNDKLSESEKLNKTRQTIAFDMNFDKFINDNSRNFTIDKDKFRESAKGLEGDELERVLSVTAAKDFFRKDENIELLPQRDRDYIKNSVIGLADNAIDYRKAFQLIEDALHVKKRVNENNSFRKNSTDSDVDNTDTPNVTAYLEKCVASGKPKSAA